MASTVLRLGTSIGTEKSCSSISSKSPSIKKMSPDKVKSHEQIDEMSPTLSPQLLAASSDDLTANLIPSISNISLLSLNQQPTTFTNTENHNATEFNNRLNNNRQRNLRGSNNQLNPITFGYIQNQIQGLNSSPTTHSSRKPSMNSPINFRRPSFANQGLSRKNSTTNEISEPDSPSLAPISIAGSPSNFLLSQNSPPSSLKSHMGSYLMANQIPRYMRKGRKSQNSQQPLAINTVQLTRAINKLSFEDQNSIPIHPMGREDSLTNSIGKSPELAPVSSTLPPMTPLNLSMPPELSMRSNSQVVFDDDDDDDDGDDDANLYNNEHLRNRNSDSNYTNNDEDIFGENLDD